MGRCVREAWASTHDGMVPLSTHHPTVGLTKARIRTSVFRSLVANSQHMNKRK